MVTAPGRFGTAQPWITLLARVALAGILAWAAWAKLVVPANSVVSVKAYRLLPGSLATVVGYGLPALELALALLLLAGFASRFTAIATAVLMVIFIGGIISVWVRGLSIDCGCFGGGGNVAASQTQYPQEILRDTGFIILAAWIAVFPKSRLSVDAALAIDEPAPRPARDVADDDEPVDDQPVDDKA
jgi:uncharacterized membrane protein YphA (DoxX/SURF4 family)